MRAKSRINVTATAKILRRHWRVSGLTQAEIAKEIELGQPQVSRILSGQFRRETPALARLCVHFGASPVLHKSPLRIDSMPELRACLEEVLDGSKKRQRIVLRLLKLARSLR
jgi:transcriptional regulator with XRE-family HTH domain